MTQPLIVSIPHKLGKAQALSRLHYGLTRAAANFPVLKVDEETWAGDRMTFRVRALGQAAHGTLDVGEDHVRVEVTLPWMLQKFGEIVRDALQSRGRLLLDKK